MSVLLNALTHGKQKMMSAKPVVIEVPEWGTQDEPAKLHISPVTIAEANAINEAGKQGDILQVVETLIQRAKDEEGDRIFPDSYREEILDQLDLDVVSRVTVEIAQVGFPAESIKGEAGKN